MDALVTWFVSHWESIAAATLLVVGGWIMFPRLSEIPGFEERRKEREAEKQKEQ